MGCGYELEIVKLQTELAQLKYLEQLVTHTNKRVIPGETDSIDALIDYIKKLEEKCAEYEKALEFYADKKTWGLSGSLHGMRRFMSLQNWGPPMNDFDVYLQPNIAGYANEPKELKYEIGGKRAREVLSKWKGKD